MRLGIPAMLQNSEKSLRGLQVKVLRSLIAFRQIVNGVL